MVRSVTARSVFEQGGRVANHVMSVRTGVAQDDGSEGLPVAPGVGGAERDRQFGGALDYRELFDPLGYGKQDLQRAGDRLFDRDRQRDVAVRMIAARLIIAGGQDQQVPARMNLAAAWLLLDKHAPK